MEKRYRADINGLRALAVLFVLFYHLEYTWAPAGFLGVDVFLVISGYLISRNIIEEFTDGKFSFSNFYTRRFKRLFPALFVTLILSVAAGYYTLTPAGFSELGNTVMASTFFYSNVFFLHEAGYFDTEAAFKPLLHIWSLSLEEQFYFIWPLALLIVFKFLRKAILPVIVVVAIVSLYIAETRNTLFPERTFYLLHFRAFEFLLGAVCIWIERLPFTKIISELCVGLGLLLICYSCVDFTVHIPMPGFFSMIPCVGAMLVIVAGGTKFSGWVLSNKAAEIIGKSSYSLYLVHWPLIVFYKLYTLNELTANSKAILGLASLVIGFFMWKIVENTFRDFKREIKLDLIWLATPILMMALYFSSHRIIINKGYPSRYDNAFVMTEEEIMQSRNRYWLKSNSEQEVLRGDNKSKIIIMGNSFAIDLIYALRKNGFHSDIISLQTTHRCFNFSGSAVIPEDVKFCSEVNAFNMADTNWKYAKAIYLFDHWPKTDLAAMDSTLTKIRTVVKVPIYVFGPKMVFRRPIPDIVHSCKSASALAINKFAQDFAEKTDRYALNSLLAKHFSNPKWVKDNIRYIDVLTLLGGEEQKFDIISKQNSKFLYFDPSHFTDQGALEFGQKIKSAYPELFD